MIDLIAPLVGLEVDLRDFPFTPIFRSRLFGSSFHARASDAGWRAGVTLWLKSWDQVPAGSLPDDDIDLCRLAELGRDMKSWKKVKDEALHGWALSTDGRRYHPVVAEGVNEAWKRKCDQRNRTSAARAARLAKTQQQGVKDDETISVTETVTTSVTDNVTASKGQGQGQGQLEEEKEDPIGSSKNSAMDVLSDVVVEPKPKAKPEAKGTRLPSNWWPDEQQQEWALEQLGTPVRARSETESFVDHWKSQPGAKGLKLDWPATYRNWVRNAVDWKGTGNGKSVEAPTGRGESVLARAMRRRGIEVGSSVGSDPGGDADPLLSAVSG